MKIALRLALALAAWAGLILTTAHAKVMAPPPLGVIAAQAHLIIVGKVESFEEAIVDAKPFPGAADKVGYKIAVIKVEDPILGAKGLTHVRVGFIPAPTDGPRRRPGVTFAKDQVVLVFLQPHGDGNFMIAPMYFDVVNKKDNPNFDKEVTETKKFGKMLSNPKESLKAEKQEDRYLAAALLITQYRTRRTDAAEPKTETVDAEVSKLILAALGEADWKQQQQNPTLARLNPQQLFMQLGVTEKDGFTPPTLQGQGPQKPIDFTKYDDYAKQWCKDNAGKYKIQRFVHEEKKDKSDK